MYVKTIIVENFRMLLDTTISIEKDMTVFVGRNNTGKTSFIKLMRHILDGNKSLSYNDIPLSLRDKVKEQIRSFLTREISIDTLKAELPTTNVRIIIDYKEDEVYGPLSNFILSLDGNDSTAEILIKYELVWSEDKIKSHFKNIESVHNRALIEEFYKNGFKFGYNAVNPVKKEFTRVVDFTKIKELISIKTVLAERELGESDKAKDDSLKKLINKIFSSDKMTILSNNEEVIEQLKDDIRGIKNKLQDDIDGRFTTLIGSMQGFGYPNSSDLSLGVRTELDVEDYVGNKAYLIYKERNRHYEELPGEYNGLGYRNLLKIEFQILDFIENLDNERDIGIKFLFIEEPESHMHPQMQQHFVEYLGKYIKKLKERCGLSNTVHIQVIMTTHSAQIANSVKFAKIRYIRGENQSVKYLNLYDFYKENRENAEFVHKYLTLSKCNVFFADKIILIEGAAERILLPDMIEKCCGKLNHQYYTIMEVGGAYAHKFIPFMKFIDVPCLIITDIDSVKKVKERQCACLVSKGECTSNATIKWWLKNIVKEDLNDLDDILNLPDAKKVSDKLRIDYQIYEGEWCGRSLEEAIHNSNKDKFGIEHEEDLELKNSKKTDFALRLIMDHNDYCVPKYIEQGLKWLASQDIAR